ncbi:apolipophorin-III-like protein precursor [Apis mellifera carnica]|uniref:Apolipophorin-III-like protein n=1 Tax=Apis mellifera TaxID=7460 RepID=A0A8U1C068_APIME|nr:apolipophorin-III-like protein precursor [Apis mellifera]ABY82793.1 apolipophorin-III-like protein [Apis mellifera]KAG9435432.1 apolipophorin-III-like protein precursor [Apis mellifera carnica]|eukprot:NP_001107670.1 apolipophorin-III-like protein precursor [Apis mellifera]
MKIILTIIFSIILISEAKVAPTSTTNSQGTPDVQLSELISQAQANINNLAKQIQEQWNIPDQDTIVKTVKDQSANFVNNIQDYIKNVTEEVKTKTPELERSWNDVKTMLNKVVDDISSGIPNAQQQVAELQSKFQQGVQTLLKESDKAAKSLSQHSGKIQEDLAKFTKQAVDIAVQATQNLNNQLQTAATQKS